MKVKNIAECSPWSIQQYFWPALSDNWSWEPIFDLFYTGFTVFILAFPYLQLGICFGNTACTVCADTYLLGDEVYI